MAYIYYNSIDKKRYNAAQLKREKIDIDDHNIYKLDHRRPYHSWTKKCVDTGDVEKTDEGYKIVWELVDKDIDYLKSELKSMLANIRYEYENKELITEDGIRFSADRQNRSIINSLSLSLKNGIISSTKWKNADDEWLLIDDVKVDKMEKLLNEHVNKCFYSENSVQEVIDSMTSVDEIEDVNIEKLFYSYYNEGNQ